MREKTLWFQSENFRLHGTLHLPDREKPPVVVGSHGLLSTGESPKQIDLAKKCNRAGIAFFRFDHRGCGQSQGDFSLATTFAGRVRDVETAVDTLQKSGETHGKIGLFGSSMGGAAVLAAAGRLLPFAVVTVAAPIKASAISAPYINDAANSRALESLRRQNLDFDISGRLSAVSGLLMFHGDADKIVPYENARRIYELAGSPKELVRLENGDHPMSDENHQELFLKKSSEWFSARCFL
ncbi:MAG: alpha/beta fold hydrolase [Desulfosalsimonadaceae bacterium]